MINTMTEETAVSENALSKPGRIQALDAARGFWMFLIIGGTQVINVLTSSADSSFSVLVQEQIKHAQWHGITFLDFVFPSFLLIAGVAFPFSMQKRLENGSSKLSLHLQIIKRGLLLLLLGLIYNSILNFDFANQRFSSVLGRIGLAWMFAALIFIHTKKWYTRSAWCGGILIVYWLLLTYIPAPDFPNAERFSMEGNIAGYIDRTILPGVLYINGLHDPEGLLGTFAAISTALLGMLTGQFLISDRKALSKLKKAVVLALGGAVLIGVGLLWNMVLPINKNLWTSSMVCYVGGFTVLLLALFYLIMDVWGLRRWAFFFTVIGMNSITSYMMVRIFDLYYTAKFLFGGILKFFPPASEPLILALAYVAVCWFILFLLYRKKAFLKV